MSPARALLMAFCLSICLAARAQNAALYEQKIKDNPDNVPARVRLAEIRLNEGQFNKAVDLLNAYTDQLSPAGFRALAFAYSSLKKYEDEARVLNIVAKRESEEENHEWRMLLGQAYLKQASLYEKNNPEKYGNLLTSAIQQLRAALKIQPKYKPAFDLLLKTLIGQKANNEAREVLIEGINAFGQRPELYRELCRIDANDGFLVQAVTNCTESINISPNYPDHYVFLIQALYDQKDEPKAERRATSAAKKFPKSEFVQWAAGTLYLRKKNYPVAARYFKAAVTADPASARAQFGLAQALYEGSHEAEALEHFIKACKADPKSVDTFLSSGARLKQSGKDELGSKYKEAANTCRP